MTGPNRNGQPPETLLEQGLRRYAPTEAGGGRMAIADFIVSLLRIDPRGSRSGR